MRVRIGEHKCGIINLRDKYPVPRHFLEAHQVNPAGMRVFGIESIGGELDSGRKHQRLCKREAYWIFTLGSLAPGGLNKDPEITFHHLLDCTSIFIYTYIFFFLEFYTFHIFSLCRAPLYRIVVRTVCAVLFMFTYCFTILSFHTAHLYVCAYVCTCV